MRQLIRAHIQLTKAQSLVAEDQRNIVRRSLNLLLKQLLNSLFVRKLCQLATSRGDNLVLLRSGQ